MQTTPAQIAPSKPWIDLAGSMLSSLKDPRHRSWLFRERVQPTNRFEVGDDDGFSDALPDIDELLDQARTRPDVLETHSPRPEPLAALLRLARSFESFENFWTTLTAPGTILLLTTSGT